MAPESQPLDESDESILANARIGRFEVKIFVIGEVSDKDPQYQYLSSTQQLKTDLPLSDFLREKSRPHSITARIISLTVFAT
jgi:hypothetical protein